MKSAAVAAAIVAALAAPPAAAARSAFTVPPLPPPAGAVVSVSTEPELQSAIRALKSGTTVVVAPGSYTLTRTLQISGNLTDVGIRGATGRRDDVVIKGHGMTGGGDVPYAVWTGGGVRGVTIAGLTIRDVPMHAIIFNKGTQRPHVYNVRLVDVGNQFIKSNPDTSGGGVNDGIVEYSVIEYTTTAKGAYTNGIDVHTGANWIIRHNFFRNIVGPAGQLAGPAVLVWNRSRGTTTEGNSFVNCARGISYGLQPRRGFDHSGGIIRNNFFFRAAGQVGDAGIHVADSPGTRVLNNTVFVSGTYATPIEYRFQATTGVTVENNLLDGTIAAKNGATGTTRGNLEKAASDLFADAAAGDLHLAPGAAAAIDKGVPSDAVTDDWDGDRRPIGAAYDVGADEYRATASRP